MDKKLSRLIRPIIFGLSVLLTAMTGWSAELPFRQFLPDHDSHVLSSASIQKLHQDSAGYIWIGFYSTGLSRYNGNSTVSYDLTDGLLDLTVREIVEDGRGHLWIGSDTGLVVSDRPLDEYELGEKARFVTEVDGTQILQTLVRRNTIHSSRDGAVWVGSTGEGLAVYRWIGGRLVHRRFSTDLDRDGNSEPVHSIQSLANGAVIISIGDRLGRVSESSADIELVPRHDSPPSAIGAWLLDSSGRLWAGGVDGRLWRSDRLGSSFVEIDSPLRGARIVEILKTPAGDVWVAALGTGVARFSAHNVSEIEHHTREDGLISNTIWSILLDHEGNLWFAQNGGISRLISDFEAFAFYRNALPDQSTFASLPPGERGSDDRIMWIGTGGGLAAVSPDGAVATLTVADGLLHNSAYALARDSRSRIWAGTVGGFTVVDFSDHAPPDHYASVTSRSIFGNPARIYSYPFQIVYSIRAMPLRPPNASGESDSLIWIAGQSGIRLIGDGRSLAFRQTSGLPGTGAVDAILDDQGYLWVATQNRGVFRSRAPFTEEKLDSFQTVADGEFGREIDEPVFEPVWNVSTGAPTNGVRNLLSADGRIWAGTVEGLAVFDIGANEPAKIINRSSGLGGEMIVGSAVDPAGESLWISQNAGIARVDIQSMNVTRLITVGDGLLDNEAWAYSSVRVGSDGTVYLSTPKGLSLYRPWLDSPTLSKPLLKIDRADIHQGVAGHRESLFEFAPLTYVNESDVVYRTRLLGYDEGWSTATDEARIRYTNLPAFGFPRRYTLEVMAKSGDGVWTDPKQYVFRALPPWWARWWALLGWIALFVVVLVSYNRFRTFSLARQNLRLEETVKERTSEIAAQAMEIETLDRIVQIINREVEFEKVLHALLEQGMVLFAEAERGGALIYDHERGTMTIPTAIGYDPDVLSKIRLSAADARLRYETAGTEIDEGIYLLRSLGDLPGVTDVEGVPIPQSMLAMAITIDDRVEAFLVFENFEQQNAFQRVSLRTARRYREHARTAVAKALILRELELRNREAQRANEAKSTFLANMSHELRTPLNSIIGFSELLVEKLDGQIAERHRHFLRLILTSGQHLLAIINDILDLSKVEAGKMQLFPEPFDPRVAIEGVQQVMRPVAAKKNVSIEVFVEPDTPSIESDPGKFKQILYNLVSNAVKFSSAGSTVTIYCRRENDLVSVSVEDKGIGIARDQLETIFDEFRQIESSMSRRFEGTGLGLSLVRRFVEFLGGQISVESELGKGSTFTFRIPVGLPASLGQEERVAKHTSPTRQHTRGRVLVVEDDHPSWELIRNALLESDLTAVRAVNGEEALRLVRTVQPDAITLDVSLPGEMSGWDVLKEIKTDQLTSDIPVIIVSHSQDHELGIALGADDYLVKPIAAEQLNERIVDLVTVKRSERIHRLLLVDDDEHVHQILGGFLEDAGYEVVSALSGTDGIKLAIDSRPDAIILDLVLPDLSGFQVAETLRQLGETSGIPVIVLTSKDLNTTEQSNLQSHLEKIVRKGTGTRPALLDAIERVLPKAGAGTAGSI